MTQVATLLDESKVEHCTEACQQDHLVGMVTDRFGSTFWAVCITSLAVNLSLQHYQHAVMVLLDERLSTSVEGYSSTSHQQMAYRVWDPWCLPPGSGETLATVATNRLRRPGHVSLVSMARLAIAGSGTICCNIGSWLQLQHLMLKLQQQQRFDCVERGLS